MSRTSVAFLQRPIDLTTGEMRLFLMGANATRTSYQKDEDTGLYLPGVLLEPAVENKCLQSQTLATTWAKIDAGDTITENTANGPDGSAVLDAIKGDATDGIHGVSQAITLTAVEWVIHGHARVGDQSWVYADDTTVANAWAYFDIANAATGTKGAGANARGVDDLKNGLLHWWWTVTGTAAAHTIRVCAAHADGDNDFVGDGATANIHAGCVQAEIGSFPTSYIITAAAATTRTADSALVYTVGGMSNREWTVLLPIMIPEHTPAADLKLFSFYKDGAAATDHVTVWADTSGYAKVTSACSGGSAGSAVTSKVISNGFHWVSIHAKHGKLAVMVDTQHVAIDTDAAISAELNRFAQEPSGAWIGGMSSWRSWKTRQPRPLTQMVI